MSETLTLPRPVTLTLPSVLYEQLQRRAKQARHTIEDELLEVVTTALPHEDALPPDLSEAVLPLSLLDDAALWRAARSHLAAEFAAELEQLHIKRQREGLTENEMHSSSRLVRQYERAMLVRAQAAAILKKRGYDVSGLLVSQ